MFSQQTIHTPKRKRNELNATERSPPSKKHRTLPNIQSFVTVINYLASIKAINLPKVKVAKDIRQQAGDIKVVHDLPGGDLKVICHSKTQFDKLLRLDLLSGKSVSVKQFLHRKQQCKGAVYSIDLNVKLADIMPMLTKQHVVFAKRLQKEKKDTTSIMLVLMLYCPSVNK